MTNPNPMLRRTQPDACRTQMSRPNPLRGRGRDAHGARRAHVSHLDREVFLRRWSLLLIASFPCREACAVHFGVTFQTACNWFDGLNSPYGHHVAFAVETLPHYRELMGARDGI